MWHPDRYMQQLYESRPQSLAFNAHDRSGWDRWRTELRQQLVSSLGGLTDMTAPLAPVLLESVECDGYVRERVELGTGESLRMPAYVLVPKQRSGQLPVVVGCHGHGYGSKAAVGLLPDGLDSGDDPNVHHQFAVSLVKRGFVVIVPELIGFGDRRLSSEPIVNRDSNSCFAIGVHLLMMGKTIAGLRIQETMRAIDYVCSRPEVDGGRIGIFGLSGGGLVAGFTAALDERIQATVISCYTNTFADSILHQRHCIDNYIPGILSYAEMPELIGLLAPKPLFIEAGRDDHLFPLHGTEKALATLRRVYEAADAASLLDHHIFPGKHEVCGECSYPWLERQLGLSST
ncbi:alpha/beta hydrolase [Paenibacillus sp. YYML68]|uniref:alpha/beta hydrolase n=1 Tax=Paenibacillus sp. YYML68 TaxID=2909250 RepID=UPI0024913633|nr:alpha/beta hydrolase family protein [Paenibacillus sp. YYML68]